MSTQDTDYVYPTNTKLVKVVRASRDKYWYANQIGIQLFVRDYPNNSYWFQVIGLENRLVSVKDVEILSE